MSEATLPASGALNPSLDALFGATLERTADPTPETTPYAARRGDALEDAELCELVARVARADQKALAALYDATVSRVFSLARGITRNLQCAEEVTEDVYWQVWRQALRFDRRRGAVMAWLLTLARSRALDHLRKRDEALAHPDPQTLVDDPGNVRDNPAERVASTERERALNAALERIDPLPRQLLALAFYRGLTHDEIAQQTQLPLGTVKSHLRRAMNTLRGVLAHDDAARETLTS